MRLRFPDRAHAPAPAYFFECLAFAAQGKGTPAYLADFPHRNAGQVQDHVREGSEFLFVIEGSLAIRFEGAEHNLKAGDSVHFDATEPHAYCRACNLRAARRRGIMKTCGEPLRSSYSLRFCSPRIRG